MKFSLARLFQVSLRGLPALLSAPILAQGTPGPSAPRLESFTIERDRAPFACVELESAPGSAFYVFGSWSQPGQFDPRRAFRIGSGLLDAQGRGTLRVSYPRALFGPGQTLEVIAISGRPWTLSSTSTLRLTGTGAGDTIDMDERPGLAPMQKGEVVTDQFSALGITVSAQNDVAAHPDKAIVFDPAGDTTGADPDLHTPLGKLLIVAENDVDRDGDQRVDVPDDEAGGGDLIFAFEHPLDLESITLVDIDDRVPSRVHLAHEGGATTTLNLLNQGDGSVQELELALFAHDVTRLTVDLGGSGGVAELAYSPCPTRLDFDETASGVPLTARRAGQAITDQYAGVTISARNNNGAHPHKAILFDSSNPTGGDPDLGSPGPGPGNDVAQGLLLILAENDVDAGGDGLIDSPDDESAGGRLVFDFAQDVSWYGATIIDIDDGGPSAFEFFDAGGNSLQTIGLVNLGDNSKQVIDLAQPVDGVRRVILRLGGSGGLAEMVYCPD